MSNKTIKFIVGVDEQSVRQTSTTLSRLTNEAKAAVEQIARAQQSAGQAIGGRAGLSANVGGGRGRIGGTVMHKAGPDTLIPQLKAQAQANVAAIRGMTTAVNSAYSVNERAMKANGQAVHALAKEYLDLAAAARSFNGAFGGPNGDVPLIASDDSRPWSKRKGYNGKITSSGGGGGDGDWHVTPGKGWGGNGGGGGGEKGHNIQGDPPKRSGMSAGDLALFATTLGRALAGAAGGVSGAIQSNKLYGENSSAAMQQTTTKRFLSGMLRGDVRDQYAMRHNKTWDGQNVGEAMTTGDWEGTKAGKGSILAQGADGLMGIGQSAAMMAVSRGKGGGGVTRTGQDIASGGSGMVGGGMGVWGAIQSWNKGGAENIEAQNITQGLDLNHARHPLQGAAFDLLAEERGMRASSSRKLMAQHLQARGVGAGYGYQFGESLGHAENLQSRNGMQGMYGDPGVDGVAPGAGGTTAVNRRNSYMKQADGSLRLVTSGVDRTVTAGSVGRAGTAGNRGLLSSSMELAGHGIGMGVGQDALSNIFQATGAENRNLVGADGKPRSNSEGAMKALERAVERGTTRGFTDPKTQEILIGAMGHAAQGKILGDFGDTSGLEAISNFLTRGGSGNMSVAATQGRAGALAGLDNLSANNPFFQGVNIASAKGILGGKGNPLSMMALGGATESELLTGGKSFDVHGISKEQRMRQFESNVASKAQAYMSLLSVEEQGRYKSGGFQGLGKDSTFKLLRSMKSFGNDETANGLSEMLTSPGGMANVSGSKTRQFADGLAVASISLEETTKASLMGKEMAKQIGEVFKDLSPEKMLEHLRKSEASMQEEAFRSGKMLIVQVVGPFTGPRGMDADARGGQSTEE